MHLVDLVGGTTWRRERRPGNPRARAAGQFV